MRSSSGFSLAEATALITSAPAPLLLVDTCSLLDIIRYPLRDRDYVVEAALLLADQASADPKRLYLVITSTIENEWVDHLTEEREAIERKLQDARRTTEALRAACARMGLSPPPSLSSDYDVIPLLLSDIASRLHDLSTRLVDDEQCVVRAHARLSNRLPPARKGGQINDCLIVEHLLALCALLRSTGFSSKCLFVSSNTNDYCDKGFDLHLNLAAEFDALDITYVTDLKRALTRLEQS